MSKPNIAERINRAWQLVVEQGASIPQAANAIGTSEDRVNRIVSALLARRNKLARVVPVPGNAIVIPSHSRKQGRPGS